VAALAGGAVEARLDAWAAEHGEPVGRWRRVFGRLEPGRSPWAVPAYEADGGPTVRVLLGEPAAGEPLGPVEIARCTADPALPGLAPTLAALERAEVVRYRPGNRCTVRGRSGGSVRYVKVLARATDDQTDARALWAAGLPFAVAEPRGWDPRRRASWYGAVPGGQIAPDLLGPGGAAVAERIGRALGELAGAPHMHQWLVDGSGRLGLVDFDRYASGEPELDVATFLVELETESPRAVGMAELSAATEDGFRAAGGRLDPDRLALWTAHKRLAKVARTAAALRPDAAARAGAHLDRLDLAGLGVDPVGVAPRLARSAGTRR
jgi:hypothetical protein